MKMLCFEGAGLERHGHHKATIVNCRLRTAWGALTASVRNRLLSVSSPTWKHAVCWVRRAAL